MYVCVGVCKCTYSALLSMLPFCSSVSMLVIQREIEIDMNLYVSMFLHISHLSVNLAKCYDLVRVFK